MREEEMVSCACTNLDGSYTTLYPCHAGISSLHVACMGTRLNCILFQSNLVSGNHLWYHPLCQAYLSMYIYMMDDCPAVVGIVIILQI